MKKRYRILITLILVLITTTFFLYSFVVRQAPSHKNSSDTKEYVSEDFNLTLTYPATLNPFIEHYENGKVLALNDNFAIYEDEIIKEGKDLTLEEATKLIETKADESLTYNKADSVKVDNRDGIQWHYSYDNYKYEVLTLLPTDNPTTHLHILYTYTTDSHTEKQVYDEVINAIKFN